MWVGGGVTSSRRMRVWNEKEREKGDEKERKNTQARAQARRSRAPLFFLSHSLTFTKPTAMVVSSPAADVRVAPDAAKA